MTSIPTLANTSNVPACVSYKGGLGSDDVSSSFHVKNGSSQGNYRAIFAAGSTKPRQLVCTLTKVSKVVRARCEEGHNILKKLELDMIKLFDTCSNINQFLGHSEFLELVVKELERTGDF